MDVKTIATVVVDKALYSFDNEFDYIIPDNMSAVVGQRVTVLFGKVRQKRTGLIVKIRKEIPQAELKEISSVVDDGIILSDEMLGIMRYLKENTFCTYFDAVKTILPGGLSLAISEEYSLSDIATSIPEDTLSEEEQTALASLLRIKNSKNISSAIRLITDETRNSLISKGIIAVSDSVRHKIGDETEKNVSLTEKYLNGEITQKLTPKQKLVVDFLSEIDSASVKEVCYNTLVTPAVIKNLEKNEIVSCYDNVIFRTPIGNIEATKSLEDVILSDEQQNVYDELVKKIGTDTASCSLLKGVTGSGKTTVFLKLIDYAIKQGKTAIMLVPEISLTPQMLKNFTDIFGSKIAVIHSHLSLGERRDEYKRIKNGDVKIVIGTRSAIFAPLDNIGIIVMDEEGEHSYKSDKTPRYNAISIAKQRCFYHNSTLLLASATPSLDSMYNAERGRYSLFEMKKRYSRSVLPQVFIVDMKIENQLGNRSNFSRALLDEIRENIKNGEQSILLLNRRGYHTYLNCIKCGEVYSCPNCNIPLTYHKANGSLTCHYCGYTEIYEKKCKKCGSQFVYASGTGTQRIEDELSMLIPEARILRMDADTTMTKTAYETSFEKFKNKEYDVMVGTQMIAKGLDFENVTLVGVLLIDKSLYAGDYLGYEKTFSLITQVVGRCGRGSKKGRAYLQTYTPDHYVLNLAADQNYDEFYNQETKIREALLFPPYCDICEIGFSSFDEALCSNGAKEFLEIIKNRINGTKLPLRILGPNKCSMARVNGKYRYRIIIKCKNNKLFRNMINEVLIDAYKSKALKDVSFYIDMNGEII